MNWGPKDGVATSVVLDWNVYGQSWFELGVCWAPCFKSYVWQQQDSHREISSRAKDLTWTMGDPRNIEISFWHTRENRTPNMVWYSVDLSSCRYSRVCFKLLVLSQRLPVRAKCGLSPTSRLAREKASSHAALLFSKCSHSLIPHTSSCQRMRQG